MDGRPGPWLWLRRAALQELINSVKVGIQSEKQAISGGVRDSMRGAAGHAFVVSLLVLLSAAIPLFSLPSEKSIWEYDRRVWQVPEGLPEDTIQAITQTRGGYLWIGTRNGLVRFDGFSFVTFDESSTPAFHDDSVLALYATHAGDLWIGTEGGGLIRYSNGSFEYYGAARGLTNGFVRAICEDNSGNLLVGTDGGLFRLSENRFVRMDGHNGLPLISVHALARDRQGRLWIGGSGFYVEAGGKVRTIALGSSAGSQQIKSILESRDGTIWVGTVSGLYRLKDGVIAHTPVDRAVEADICEDQSGNVWVGWVGGGLSRIHDGKFVTYRAPAILPGNTVLSIFEDSGQNLWIGTENGLLRLSYTGVSILERKDGLSLGNASTIYENVSTIYAAPDGTLWIANGHLYRIVDQHIVRYYLPPQIQHAKVRMVYEDRHGVLWIGTGGQGVIALRHGRATEYTTREGLTNDFIRAFCEDRAGNLWIGTDGGVSRWDGKAFQNFNTSNGLVYPSVRAIVKGANGSLWIATDGGLSLFRNGSFVHNPVLRQLQGYRIWAIHQGEDAPGVLWLGTRGNGLFRLKDGRLAHYTAQSGLPNENIYQILQDHRGNLWMSSPGGVFRVQIKSLDDVAAGKAKLLAVTVYRVSEGLPVTETNGGVQPAGTSTRSGTLWFPTYKGAIRIEPDELRSSRPGQALIEKVVADGRLIPLRDSCSIQPGDGRLEIYYNAPSLLAPERTRFKYKLAGFDKQWTYASSRRIAYYTNLPPGQYQFRVRAFDNRGAKESSEADFSFTWEAHFYQTAWFYSLCGLSLAMLGWAAYRMHLARTKARFAAILAERTRLAREIHDTIIQGCIGVSTLLEAADSFDHSLPQIVLDLLDRARAQIRQTLNEARESVWNLRHSGLEDGGMAPALLRELQQLSKETGVPVESEVRGTPAPLESQVQINLLLVAREAMRNAIAHANPHRVLVRLCFAKDRLSLEVSDDGCGFDPQANSSVDHQHYGIMGMRERIEQLGGQFELFSSLGEGTHVLARVPLRGTVAHPSSPVRP